MKRTPAVPDEAMAVLQYWFLELLPEDWFASSKERDDEITTRFGDTLARAKSEGLDDWAETPRGLLALVIVLDQFSRNIHRDNGKAFAADAKAQELTLIAIEAGMDERLGLDERQFLYMPLMHAEDLELQTLGVAKYEALAETAAGVKGFCIRHRDIIAEFGRFPYRNEMLGRVSTSEEREFIEREGNPFG